MMFWNGNDGLGKLPCSGDRMDDDAPLVFGDEGQRHRVVRENFSRDRGDALEHLAHVEHTGEHREQVVERLEAGELRPFVRVHGSVIHTTSSDSA
jgi:hypothetical protein